MVPALTTFFRDSSKFLLKHLRPCLWWHSNSSIHRIGPEQDKFIDIHNIDNFNCDILPCHHVHQEPEKEDREVQEVLNVANQAALETEV